MTAFFALSSTNPASLRAELTSIRAPDSTVVLPSANTMMLPPFPSRLRAESPAFAAMAMSFAALTVMLPALPVLLFAVSRPKR